MNEKILQAVKDTLPSIQAKELEWFFESYSKMEKENETLNWKVESLYKENLGLKENITEDSILKMEKIYLKEERDKFEEEKRELKIKELEYKLEQEKKSTEKITWLVETIFRNRFFNKNMCGNMNNLPTNSYESVMEQTL